MDNRHASRIRRSAFAIALGAILAPASLQAQFTEAPAPAAYALQNVTVVRPDGSTDAGQTVVVRAGRIETLARGAAVPADARVLEGDTLYVYPGFIDAAGTVPFEFPRDTTDRSRVRSWDPPRSLQGFMPARRVLDHLAVTGSDLASLRRKGIVAAAVHPPLDEALMQGRGALVLLRPNAATPQALVLQPELAPLMSLRGSRGLYPSTQMGVLAWYRQTFLDAQHQLNAARANGDASGPSPTFDPDMNVVQDLLRTNGRVFFVANDANEIRRVLDLAREFSFRPVIVGGAEAWQVASELRAADVPVLVSIDFTEPRRWKPDAKPDSTEAPAPLEPAVIREKRELENVYSNAGRLAAAGVTFALVSGPEGDDLLEGARKVVEYGLGETDALRALTVTPAALLGVPQLARVARGGAATFIVTDRPVLDEDARILYTFVEGVLEKGAAPGRRNSGGEGGQGGDAVSAAGTWTMEMEGPPAQTITLKLTQDGSELTGTMESPQGTIPVSGTIEGAQMTMRGTLTVGGQSLELEIRGEIDGDTASGVVATPMGDMDWTARRTPGARS